ncbi:MAG: hypothetical protein ACTSWX_16310 [Promethearchaeota archaeon]
MKNFIDRFPNFWWTNQGHSYKREKGQKYIWAPKEGKRRAKYKHWQNVGLEKKGDIIFNYANSALRGVSLAKNNAFDFYHDKAEDWNKDGIRVDITHFSIDPIDIKRIKSHSVSLKQSLVDKYDPFDKEGNIKQGYLFEFSLNAAKIIREIYGKKFPDPIEIYVERKGMKPQKAIDPIIELLLKKGQIILYGPPGTGKTFFTKKYSIEVMEKNQ